MSVSVGGNSDVMLVYEGGKPFQDRMSAYLKAKSDAQKSLADLNLGTDVGRAHADAKAKLADAGKTLADARAKADQIVRDAKSQADEIIRAADQTRVLHEGLRAEAESAKAAAQKRMKEADEVARNAEAVERQHMAQESRAREAEAKFKALADRLRSMVKAALDG